ncbi:MAG TPA: hypothetical protein VGV38_02540 [Pyrinomonadaceae bacterium]|nr:hypothetical protein [Pyrinomonadaceae bacterium]
MPVPDLLRKLTESISHPALVQTGETKTADGRWALLAVVRRDTPPAVLEEIAELAGDFPIVFENAEREFCARPAYPERGE